MREYSGDTRFIRLESQTFAEKQSSFKVFYVMQIGHRHCLATIAFFLDMYFL